MNYFFETWPLLHIFGCVSGFQDLSTRKPAPRIEIYHSDLRKRKMHKPWLHHPGKASPALRTSGRAPLSARAATRVVQNVREFTVTRYNNISIQLCEDAEMTNN